MVILSELVTRSELYLMQSKEILVMWPLKLHMYSTLLDLFISPTKCTTKRKFMPLSLCSCMYQELISLEYNIIQDWVLYWVHWQIWQTWCPDRVIKQYCNSILYVKAIPKCREILQRSSHISRSCRQRICWAKSSCHDKAHLHDFQTENVPQSI